MNVTSTQFDTPTAPVQTPVSPEEAAQRRELVRAVKAVNETAALGDRNELVFVMDRAARRPIMQVIDRNTKEVVMQLPPEYILRLAESATTTAE